MLKSLAIYLAKKYAVAAVQDAVAAKKPQVSAIALKVPVYALKVSAYAQKAASIVAFLNALALRLADGELTDQEAADTIAEAKELAETVTK